MAIGSIDSFLAVLRRVQLLDAEQVDEIARELAPEYKDPRDLADYLTQIEWLTPYQNQCIFEENGEGLTVGPYQLLGRLGAGGVSEVFRAWDSYRARVVALKVLRRDLASQREGVRQFERELQVLTRLSHPNVVKTFDAQQYGNVHCIAMEIVEGTDLHHHVGTEGPLPVEQACDYVRQAAQGLQHAHQSGLVHRDVKPANLILTNVPGPASTTRRLDPVVKILDWGLARMLPTEGSEGEADEQSENEKGMLIGTADFVAPEQARDPSLVDTRADIYSLGCTLYFLLTGRPPFEGRTMMQKLLRHQQEEPTPLRQLRPDIPEELEALVQRMMAKKPEDRFQIPLLVVVPLRRFCPSAQSSVGSLIRPTAITPKPSTLPALNLPATEPAKPSSSAVLTRPGSSASLNRPASSANLNRPASRADLTRPATR